MTRRLHSVTNPVAEDLAAQDAALDVDCPRCGAERDDYCRNPATGRPLHNRISHWQRLRAVTDTATSGNDDTEAPR